MIGLRREGHALKHLGWKKLVCSWRVGVVCFYLHPMPFPTLPLPQPRPSPPPTTSRPSGAEFFSSQGTNSHLRHKNRRNANSRRDANADTHADADADAAMDAEGEENIDGAGDEVPRSHFADVIWAWGSLGFLCFSGVLFFVFLNVEPAELTDAFS
jgi:hypothetical protein